MIKISEKNYIIISIALALFFFAEPLISEEKIVQKEEMSFEQCLKVIEVSKNKLSIAPKISDLTPDKRIAIFSLSDGILKIACDRNEGFVTVSTKLN